MIEGYTLVGEDAYEAIANQKADNRLGNESPFKQGEVFELSEGADAKPHFYQKQLASGRTSTVIIILLKNVATGIESELFASSLNKKGVVNQHYVENTTPLAVRVKALYAKGSTNKEIGNEIINFFKQGRGICSVEPWTERVVYSNGNSQNKLRHLIGFVHENEQADKVNDKTDKPNTDAK